MKINTITSRDNEKIRHLKRLGQKKYRNRYNQFCVENLVIIHDAMKAGFGFESVFLTKSMVKLGGEKIDYVLSNVEEYYLIDDYVNKGFSSLDTPAGICAVYSKITREILTDESIIYLNAISNPGNLGTILRTALAFGFRHVVIDENCADIYNYKTINASKDAVFKLHIEHDKELEMLKGIKGEMDIFATSLDSGSNIHQIKNEDSVCIVLGNESSGVSSEILNIADNFIKIEMSGDIESLNVAITAGIILYEISKKT